MVCVSARVMKTAHCVSPVRLKSNLAASSGRGRSQGPTVKTAKSGPVEDHQPPPVYRSDSMWLVHQGWTCEKSAGHFAAQNGVAKVCPTNPPKLPPFSSVPASAVGVGYNPLEFAQRTRSKLQSASRWRLLIVSPQGAEFSMSVFGIFQPISDPIAKNILHDCLGAPS